MVLKTFNLEEETYRRFSDFCKSRGMTMSKQVEFFMRSVVEKEHKAKKQYIEKLNRIRKQKSLHIGTIDDFEKRYGLK